MKGKSILVQILSAVILVIGSAGSLLSVKAMAVAGVVSAALTLVMKTFFPSGYLVQGWTMVLWITNVGFALIQIVNLVGTISFISPTIVNALAVIVNTVILVVANQENGTLANK